LNQARNAFERFTTFLDNVHTEIGDQDPGTVEFEIGEDEVNSRESAKNLLSDLNNIQSRFVEAMDDDFNSAAAIGILYDLVKTANIFIRDKDAVGEKVYKKLLPVTANSLQQYGEILGIFGRHIATKGISSKGDEEKLIDILVDTRDKARDEKVWVIADFIRDRLKELHIILEDSHDGTKWRRQI
jgi:cysteinyl-tRNA synthetase